MRHDPKAYLWDIQEATLRITEATSDISFDEYKDNWIIAAAVERQFTTIGEAMARLVERHPTVAVQISEHKTIIGFRIVIVRRYPRFRPRNPRTMDPLLGIQRTKLNLKVESI